MNEMNIRINYILKIVFFYVDEFYSINRKFNGFKGERKLVSFFFLLFKFVSIDKSYIVYWFFQGGVWNFLFLIIVKVFDR